MCRLARLLPSSCWGRWSVLLVKSTHVLSFTTDLCTVAFKWRNKRDFKQRTCAKSLFLCEFHLKLLWIQIKYFTAFILCIFWFFQIVMFKKFIPDVDLYSYTAYCCKVEETSVTWQITQITNCNYINQKWKPKRTVCLFTEYLSLEKICTVLTMHFLIVLWVHCFFYSQVVVMTVC